MTELYSLIAKAQAGDKTSMERLIEDNSALVWSVVRRFIGRGTDPDDLYQLGCLGFLKAVEGFDLEYGTQFSTYAVPKIAGEIRRFLRDDGAIKVSRTIKEQATSIRVARSNLSIRLGREPSVSEISEITGLSVEEIATADTATAATESIHKENGEDGFCLEDILSVSDSEETMVERICLTQAIGKLPQREKQVIDLRYFHGLTQQKIAKLLDVSQVQVSRIEKKALLRLREWMG